MTDRKLDAVTARALRLALAPDFDLEAAARDLLVAAGGSWPLLNAVLIRFDRALSLRWSEVEARASEAVRLALESTSGAPLRSAV